MPWYMRYSDCVVVKEQLVGVCSLMLSIRVLKIKFCGMYLYLLSYLLGPASIDSRSCGGYLSHKIQLLSK